MWVNAAAQRRYYRRQSHCQYSNCFQNSSEILHSLYTTKLWFTLKPCLHLCSGNWTIQIIATNPPISLEIFLQTKALDQQEHQIGFMVFNVSLQLGSHGYHVWDSTPRFFWWSLQGMGHLSKTLDIIGNIGGKTWDASFEARPPCLKRDHGVRSFI